MNSAIGWGFVLMIISLTVFEVVMRIHEAYQVPL